MKLMNFFCFLLFILCIFPNPLKADNPAKSIQLLQEKGEAENITILLPINVSKNINVRVLIPKNYKILDNPQETQMMEFIPKEDKDPYAWSEIITTIPFVGKKLKSDTIIESALSGITQKAAKFEILEETQNKDVGYEESSSILKYTNNGRIELLKVYAVSGPYDAGNVQYAIHLESDKDTGAGLKKIKKYFNENVKVIK